MDMNVNSHIIIELRNSRAWTQQHLAEVSGLSLRTVQRIENSGTGAPDSIKAIAVAFGLVPADLMSNKGDASSAVTATSVAPTAGSQDMRQSFRLLAMMTAFCAVCIVGATIWLSVGVNGQSMAHADEPSEGKIIYDPKNEEINQAAMAWLHFVDSEEFATSWQEADPLVHSQVTAKDWENAVQPVRKPLGKVLQRKAHSLQLTTTLPGLPTGEYAIYTFKTEFETKPGSIETLPMSKSTGTWRPIGYFIK